MLTIHDFLQLLYKGCGFKACKNASAACPANFLKFLRALPVLGTSGLAALQIQEADEVEHVPIAVREH